MKEEEFLKRLSEVAEWDRPLSGPNGLPSVKKRSLEKKLAEREIDYDEDGNEIEVEPTPLFNDSIAPVITKLKPILQVCPDCDRMVEDRRLECKLNTTTVAHWRIKCTACKCYQNPNTGEFNLTDHQETQNAFRKYVEKKLRDK